jgi:predicted RNA binding protein YcfA (HicA-like mRNA interferase family)
LKLPRDLEGAKLASLLRRHGYQVTRQTGSHMRMTSTVRGPEHHVTIPAHKALGVGTLRQVLGEVATYLEMDLAALLDDLFRR